ncbi:type II secretion system protein E, partial [mine drainage metagenome]
MPASGSTSFRVKIPRTPPAGASAPLDLDAGTASSRPATDVPGTFITALPPLAEPSMRELEVRAVNPPYSYSRVSYNDRTKEYLYEILEPQLSAHEKGLVTHLKATLTQILGSETAELSTADKR